MRPGAGTRVRPDAEGRPAPWLPDHAQRGDLDRRLPDGLGPTSVRYRPTVHYAYHPCDDAILSLHEFAGKTWTMQPEKRLMMEEIVEGIDELGVLLMGHKKGAYWFGSQLSIHQARELAPHNNATSLQVTASALAGVIWAIENPRAGIVEPEELNHQRVLEIAGQYLGKLVGSYSDWTPLEGRGVLFPEDVDTSDPWQFKNFRVV